MYEQQPFILLVDDDQDDLDMLSSALQLKGAKVKSFLSSQGALLYLADEPLSRKVPALIILDYNMPGCNGHQVLLSIVNNLDIQHIPVVIYSTGMSEVLKMRLLKDGAADCLEKAWTYQQLNTNVEAMAEMAGSFRIVKGESVERQTCLPTGRRETIVIATEAPSLRAERSNLAR